MVHLPLINEDGSNSLRQYRGALTAWSSHVADEAGIGVAGVYANARLPGVPEANCILGEVLPDRSASLEDYFRQASTRPLLWHFPGSSPVSGMVRSEVTLMLLQAAPDLPGSHSQLTIIPARASFPHVRQIAAALYAGVPAEQAAEAAMCHLDDAHVDAILAIHNGQPVAYASVLSCGDIGFVMDFFVYPELRHRGFATPLAAWVFDVCRRSLYRLVYSAACTPEAVTFATRMGFVPAATSIMYRAAL